MGWRRLSTLRTSAALATLLFTALGFQAQAKADLFSFTFSDLDGAFAATSPVAGLFTAVHQAGSPFSSTQGDVSRLVPVMGSVTFNFADAAIGAAAFDLAVTTTAINDNDALATGSLTLTDVDGDTITAMLDGQWLRVGTSANLLAVLTDVELDNTSADGTFDGTAGTPWSMDFAVPEPYEGNIINLAFLDWFTDLEGAVEDFEDATTLASGAVTGNAVPLVPEPATLVLLALAALPTLRRRQT